MGSINLLLETASLSRYGGTEGQGVGASNQGVMIGMTIYVGSGVGAYVVVGRGGRVGFGVIVGNGVKVGVGVIVGLQAVLTHGTMEGASLSFFSSTICAMSA